MIKRTRVLDRFGREIEDGEGRIVVPDGARVSVGMQFMDARAGASAPPPGKYFKRDNCGRVYGIGDVAGELRRVGAAEDYGQRLAKRP